MTETSGLDITTTPIQIYTQEILFSGSEKKTALYVGSNTFVSR